MASVLDQNTLILESATAMSRLSAATIQSLRQALDTACADGEKGISGTTVVVVGKDGGELFAHAGGKRGVESKEPMTLDSIYWIASCTKMICGLACMQLVEQGNWPWMTQNLSKSTVLSLKLSRS